MTNNFQLYWARIVQKNPKLSTDDTKMTISVAAFKKQQEKAFRAGRDAEVRDRGGRGTVDDLLKGLGL